MTTTHRRSAERSLSEAVPQACRLDGGVTISYSRLTPCNAGFPDANEVAVTTSAQRLPPDQLQDGNLRVLHPDRAAAGGPSASESAQTEQGWREAKLFVIRQLLADVTLDPLRLVANALMAAANADCVLVLAMPGEGGGLQTVVALGRRATEVTAQLLNDAPALPRHVWCTGEPLHVLDTHAPSSDHRPAASSMLLLPLPRVIGNVAVLVAVRFPSRPDFTLDHLAEASEFAHHAGALVELSAAHLNQHRRDTSLSGPSLDTAASADTRDDAVAVLRKILTDIALHAQAGALTVALHIAEEHVSLEVIDDSEREPSGTSVVWSTSTP